MTEIKGEIQLEEPVNTEKVFKSKPIAIKPRLSKKAIKISIGVELDELRVHIASKHYSEAYSCIERIRHLVKQL